MSLNKELIIGVLSKNVSVLNTDGPVYMLDDADIDKIADQILSALQLNGDAQPPLQQAGVMRAQSAEPLALLEQELNRVSVALESTDDKAERERLDRREWMVIGAIELIKDIQQKASSA